MQNIIASTYEIEKKLGSGGGGNVYLARHKRLDKKVVLKADKRQLSTPPALLRREVDVLKTLRHANIPQVYDFFVENDTVYTVMDYIEGESLDHPLKQGKTFPQAQVIEWARQLLDALVYLHSPTHGDPPRGFIHSDIKPANIMLLPDGNICLIDFNIALALGEENVIGCSAGYSSPEHYGLDFSVDTTTSFVKNQQPTAVDVPTTYVPDDEVTAPATLPLDELGARGGSTSTAARVRTVTPDIRSDIYSMGATLYHLLSGQRPARDAREVEPLSEAIFSPQVAAIINKAMAPNPDERYQTAAEMLAAFDSLWQNDPRTKHLIRSRALGTTICSVLLAAGVATAFVGLKRMETTESWLKLAEYSADALQNGDVAAARSYALQALPTKKTILTPACTAQAQKALADALGVYDLADSFAAHGVVELPSAPLCIRLSPNGTTAACLYAEAVAVFDTESCQIIATLPADASALSEVEYINEDRIAYAGREGVTVYDIPSRSALWQGAPGTAIAVSADGSRMASVYLQQSYATIYDTITGTVQATVDFDGRSQQSAYNDAFANPEDNLLAINEDGTLLAVSFSDGSLWIYDLVSGTARSLQENGSGYTHFEGGFSGRYFAFSASNAADSFFSVADTETWNPMGEFQSPYAFCVQTDPQGIYLQTQNLLVKLNPESGEQIPLVTTAKNILAFSKSDTHAVIATADSFDFFDESAMQTTTVAVSTTIDFVRLAGGTALAASRDLPTVRVLTYQNHAETELLAYDPMWPHDEARLSADGQTVMLFSYDAFRVYKRDGTVVAEATLPNAEQVYDQQFRREGEDSFLEVFYYDGSIVRYSAADGRKLGEQSGEPPDPGLFETYETDTLRIEAPLHGTPTAWDRQTGKQVAALRDDAYLTYITQAGDFVVAQYVTADGRCFGELMNAECEVLANLPYLCDVRDETLIFDYPTGNMRQTRIYYIDELLTKAQNNQ